MAEFADFKQR